MSTTAAIGRLTPDGLTATVIQWDGYPTSLGYHLAMIAARDGLGTALDNLLARTEWATLYDFLPDLADVTPDPQAEGSTPAYLASMPSVIDGTLVAVPGYGFTYAAPFEAHLTLPASAIENGRVTAPDFDSSQNWWYLFDADNTLTVYCPYTDQVVTIPADRLLTMTDRPAWEPVEDGSYALVPAAS